MQKKILLSLISVVAVGAGVVGMSAFEAHVINVTAHIENALYVPVEAAGLSFGTIFPEEVLYKNFDFGFSDSFKAEDRVDDVEYVLRQKPKCGVPVPNTDPIEYSDFVQVTDGPNGTFVCPKDSVMLPLLCPYLSKTELDDAGKPTSNTIPAFHGPLTNWTMADTLATQLRGRLSKASGKTSSSWMLDLHAPCFKGMCAQDNVIPPDYQADPQYESELFGCDLWIEVTNISLPPKTSLTVIKHVINDSGTGSSTASDFTMNVTGINPVPASFPGAESPGTNVTLDAGLYSVDETGPVGYTKTLSTDCSGTIALNEHKTCTITNDDIPIDKGYLTVVKLVENNGVGTKMPGNFQMTIDAGNVNQNQEYTVNVGNHTVSEVDNYGYDVTYSAECPAGIASVPKDGHVTCTVTNTYPVGTLTVHKVVVNNEVGTKVAANFHMTIDTGNVNQDQAYPVSVGNHTVSEVDNYGYDVTYSAECPAGVANVPFNGNVTCTVTNTMPFGTITVTKTVTNDDGGLLTVGSFTLKIDGVVVTSGTPKNVAVGAHKVTEVGLYGYSALVDGDCTSTGDVSVPKGQNRNCSIVNNDIAPIISIVKNVVGGTASPNDFNLSIDHTTTISGSSNQVTANFAHVIDEEVIVSGYSFTSIAGSSFLGVSCPAVLEGTITLLPGDVVTCTITNTHS